MGRGATFPAYRQVDERKKAGRFANIYLIKQTNQYHRDDVNMAVEEK
jgi:hypothetical protein